MEEEDRKLKRTMIRHMHSTFDAPLLNTPPEALTLEQWKRNGGCLVVTDDVKTHPLDRDLKYIEFIRKEAEKPGRD